MQAQQPSEETRLDIDLTDTAQPLRVVIAYNDLASGKRAMRVLVNLAKGLADDIKFQPVAWSFDLLADVDWCRIAANDAVKADILIIVTSSASPLPPAVGRWAEAVISQKRGTATSVVALFGHEENPDGAGSSRLESIRTAAQRAGLDFFAPEPRQELDGAIDIIHAGAETVTPIFNEILHHDYVAARVEQHR